MPPFTPEGTSITLRNDLTLEKSEGLTVAPFWFALLTALLLSSSALWPLWMMNGIPAFNHDWSWPPDRIQAWSQFHDSISPYTSNNFGQYNFYIGGAPSVLVIALFVQMFGAQLGAKALVSALLYGSLVAAFVLAKRLGAPPILCASCALLYAVSPVVANELAAGHLAYMFGYAALPSVLLAGLQMALRPRPLLAALTLAAVVPFSIAQPQFIIFDAAVILMLLPWAQRHDRVRVVISALAVMLAAPYEIGLALFSHPLAALSVDRANLHWESANSSSLWGAYMGSGYVRPYDAGVATALLVARAMAGAVLWVVAVASAARARRWAPFLVLALVAAWLSAGANGPLWNAISFSFVHIPQAAIYRELYHFSGVVLLALLLLCAVSRSRQLKWLLPIAVLFFSLPQMTGNFWRYVGAYDPTEINKVAEIVGADPSDGSVLFWPSLQPVGRHATQSGSDPDAFAIGSHSALWQFVPLQPLSQIGSLLCASKSDPQRILAQFGVRYVIVRSDWRSFYDQKLEPGLRALTAGRDRSSCPGTHLFRSLHVVWRGASHTLASVSNPKSFVSLQFTNPVWRLPVEHSLEPSVLTSDPRLGWVDGNRWQWWDAGFAGPVNPGIFTLGNVAYELPPRSGGMQLIVNAPGGLVFAGKSTHVILRGAPGFRAVHIPKGASEVRASAPAMLAGLSTSYQMKRDDPVACGSRCPRSGVEILALPGAPWSLGSSALQNIAPIASSWDLKWSIPAGSKHFEVEHTLKTPIEVALVSQYLSWLLSCASLMALVAIYILRSIRRAKNLSSWERTEHG